MPTAANDAMLNKHQQSARKTCVRYDEPGAAHFLTFSCFQRKQVLAKDRTRQWFVNAVCAARQRLEFDVWAYVIMPEHCHLLLHPRTREYCISRILSAIKIPVAKRARSYLAKNSPKSLDVMLDRQPNGRQEYRFWQRGGGYDRNLYDACSIHKAIEYIHFNPVRRSLVTQARQWHWSSASYYEGRRDVPMPIDVESVPTLRI